MEIPRANRRGCAVAAASIAAGAFNELLERFAVA